MNKFYNKGKEVMYSKKIIDILLTESVYDELKQNEQSLFELIPELKKCKGFNQNNEWHIYDVYEHILHVVSAVDKNIFLRIAALFHDIGKPFTYTEDVNGVGHFYNHWNKSIEIFKKYQDKFNITNEDKKLINNLIFYHDINIGKMSNSEKIIMINNIGINDLELLFSLKKADLLAQSPKYHNLLTDIKEQEENIIKIKELKYKK